MAWTSVALLTVVSLLEVAFYAEGFGSGSGAGSGAGPSVCLQTVNITVDETDENTTAAVCVSVRYPEISEEMEVTVAFSTTPGTTEDNDFVPLSDQLLTIPLGATSACQNITIIGDRIVEDNEEFIVGVNVQSSAAVLIGPNSTTVTIIDDDGGMLQLQDFEVFILETESTATTRVCISLQNSEGLERDIPLYIFTSNGTAGTDDFVPVELQQDTFITNSSTMVQTLCQTITILGDRFIENDEFFFVMVIPSNPLDSINRNYSQITILDDDGAVITLQTTAIVMEETYSSVCITLQDVQDGLMRSVVVNVTTIPGTAGPSDFTLLNNTLQFPSGSSVDDSVCAVIEIIMDNIVERDETFTVSLSPENSNDGISPNATLVTIEDDDRATVFLNETDIVVQEGDSNTIVDICVVLEDDMGGLERNIVVTIMLMPDTINSMDVILLEREVVIPSTTARGNGVCVAAITVLGDDTVEGNETFHVSIQPTNPNDIVPTFGNTTTITIVDDDGAILTLQDREVFVMETDNVTTAQICVSLQSSAELERSISLYFSTSDGTAGTEDFVPVQLQQDTFITNSSTLVQTLCQTITILGDRFIENDEFFFVMVIPSNPLDSIDRNYSQITILDDDGATIFFESAAVEFTIPESYVARVCITLQDVQDGLMRSVVVNVTTIPGTAAQSDFTLLNNTLQFPSGSSVDDSVCAEIEPIMDNIVERNENFTVSVSTENRNDEISPNATLVTIEDDDGATVFLNETDIVVQEGDSNTTVDICVVLEDDMGGLERNIVVTIMLMPDSINTMDVILLEREVVIPSTTARGNGVCVAAITVLGDDTVEGNETFRVTIQPTNPNDRVSSSGSTATVTIVDDDGAALSLQDREVFVMETDNVTTAQICVFLQSSAELERNISLYFSTSDGTAGTEDFVPVEQGTLITSSFSMVQALCQTITILGDRFIENDEFFFVMVIPSNPLDSIDRNYSQITILDDDGTTIFFESAAGEFPIPESYVARVCITLQDVQDGLMRSVVVNVTTIPGTAAQSDFTLLNNTLQFPSGSSVDDSVCAEIEPIMDNIVERDETFTVSVSTENRNDEISPNATLVTIEDDDGATVFLNETDIVVQEGDSNTTVDICVVLEDDMGGLERNIVVTIMLMPDTINTMDVILLEREVVIPSTTARGNGVCVAAITVLGDDTVEGNETFRVTIQPTNPNDRVPSSGSTATVTIVDDDGAALSLQDREVFVMETDNVTTAQICVFLQSSAELERNISLYFSTSDGTAGTEDFVPVEQGTLITSSFSMVQALCQTITILGDRFIENDEFFFVMVIPSNPLDSIDRNYSLVTILDDDGANIVLQNTSITTAETYNVSVCITLQDVQDGLMRSVVVNVTTVPGTAAQSDFTLLNNTLQFPSGSSVDDSVCAVIEIIMDNVVERDETFTVSLSTENSNDEISPNAILVTIEDDDGATVFLNETDIVVQEGDSNTTVDICVVLEDDMGGLERNIVVTIMLMPDTINTMDVILLEREVVIPSTTARGNGVCVAAITVLGDDTVEGNETFSVTIQPTNPNDRVPRSGSTATVTIVDDDGAALSLQDREVFVMETDNVTTVNICVSLQSSAELERNISLYFLTSIGTAGTEDFVPFEQGTLITSSFSMVPTRCQPITILGDRFIENDEFFFVMVIPSNPLDSIDRNYSQITILDDDGANIVLQNTSITTAETYNVSVCITLQDVQDGLMRSVVVNVMPIPGTAAQSDFTLLNNTLQFPSGSSVDDSVCAVIEIIMDNIVERDETFTVSLSTENSNDEISPNATLVTIEDDDGATVFLSETDIVVQEGDGNSTVDICVVLGNDMGGLERDIVINLMTVPDTASAAMDFVPLEREVVIPSTTAQGEIVCVANITILEDDSVEGNETFSVTIQPTNPNDRVPMLGSVATVTIVDDELPPIPSPTSSPAESLSSTQEATPSPSLPEVVATSPGPVTVLLTSSALEVLTTSTSAVPTSLLSTIQVTSIEAVSSTVIATAAITTSPVSVASSPVSVASSSEVLVIISTPTLVITSSPITIETTSVTEQITSSEGAVSSAESSSPIVVATSLSVVPQITTSVAPTPSPSTLPTTSQPLPSPTTTSTFVLSTPTPATEQPTVLATPTQVPSSSLPSPSPTPGPEQPTLVEGIDYIRFLPLGGNGVPTNFLSRALDGISSPIYIPFGLPFGESIQETAYVSTNGAISFGRGWFFWYPEPFPTNRFFVRNSFVVAPFWSDNDIRLNGTIRYEVHSRSSGTNSTSGQLLDQVSSFIVEQENLTTGSFLGQWMLVAEWYEVHPYPHGASVDGNLDVQFQTFVEKANTYQAIVITDGTQSYTVYTYNCQMMEWSGLSAESAHAVVGYNSFGLDFENDLLSGTPDIIEIACQNQELGTDWNNLIFSVGATSDLIQQRRAECTRRITEDITIFGDTQLTAVFFVQPCPCSFFQAIRDRRFTFNREVGGSFLSTNLCFHQRFPSFLPRSLPTQLCCYTLAFGETFGSLITSGEEGSSLLLFHPRFSRQEYLMYDIELRSTCCGLARMCDQFSNRRPPNDCRLYRPPFFGWGWGDPHVTTLDGRVYTFNGLGEYTLLQIAAEGANGEFSLQGRTMLVVNSTATQYSAFAFGQQSAAFVEVRYENGSFVVLSNGNDISSNLSNVNDTYTNQTVEISRSSNDSVTSVFSNGASVTIQVAEEIPNFVLTLPQSFRGQTRGLLGNYNGQDSDDFVYPDGGMLRDNASDSMIHDFGQAWQISQNESLFTYADGQSVTTFSDPNHTPVFLDDVLANAAPEIVATCNNDPMCIFDYNQTGNPDVGMATLMTNQNNNNDQTLTLNYPPTITGANRFRVNTQQESVYTFNATDDGGNFTVSLLGETPANADLVTDGTIYTFRWVLASADNITVAFTAVDNLQARSVIDPQVEICACENGGTCTLDGVLDLDADPIVMNCECPEAWTGTFCEEDVNGCSVVSCFEEVQCFDVTAPGVGAMCGPCPTGYSGDGIKCSDIDECSRSTGSICEQVCVNTDGSFECRCFPGFRTVNDTQCEDIDECNEVNDCHQECTNTEGSYICSCLEGFVLNSDNRTCSVMPGNECSENNNCSQICLRFNGTVVEQCSCMRGYQLSNDNATCDDVDECMMQPPCEQICNNTVGSFMCTCGPGYTLNANGVTCDDINECRDAALDRTILCPQPQLCENNPGSYQCVCPPGTEMINVTSCREIVIPEPTRIQTLVSTTTITEQPTVQPTITPTPTPTTTPVSNTALANALRVTLPQFTAENFTEAVQERFRNTTAMVVNSYCAENDELCRQTVAVARRRRQVSQIQPGDVIIINITNNAQGQVEFVMFIQVAGGTEVLAVGALESALQSGLDDYRNAGFTTIEFIRVVPPTETPTGFSAGEIAGIVIGSVVGFLLLLLLLILLIFLCYKKCCRRHHKGSFELSYGVVYREPGHDYTVHNELAIMDETSVQSMKLTFADEGSDTSKPESPTGKEDLGSQDIVTAL